MNIISRLFLFYEQAELQKHRPIGDIFNYESDFVGPKMLAEFVVRMKEYTVASLLFPPNGVDSILTLPSGKYRSGFHLDHKIEGLFEKKHFILVMQREAFIETGNYVVLKISEEGDRVYMYYVLETHTTPVLFTNLELDLLETHSVIVEKMFQIVLGEMETVLGPQVKTFAVTQV